MNETAELPLTLPAPAVTPEKVQQLVAVLFEAGGWFSARDVAAQMATSDREVRAIASAARPAVVSYPGSPGYKLWQLCSLEEINHCIEAFESQGKDMLKCAVLYRQAYHKRFRGAPGPEAEQMALKDALSAAQKGPQNDPKPLAKGAHVGVTEPKPAAGATGFDHAPATEGDQPPSDTISAIQP